MGNTQFLPRVLVSYCKNQLQFPYHLTLPGIRYPSRVLCPCRPFLYPYMVMLPVFLRLLPFKRASHYLTFILHLPSIITFCFPRCYGTMHLNRVLPCPTQIGFLTSLVPNIIYPSCLGSLLFDKYRQRVYKSWDTGFIRRCPCQAPVIAAKSTMP